MPREQRAAEGGHTSLLFARLMIWSPLILEAESPLLPPCKFLLWVFEQLTQVRALLYPEPWAAPDLWGSGELVNLAGALESHHSVGFPLSQCLPCLPSQLLWNCQFLFYSCKTAPSLRALLALPFREKPNRPEAHFYKKQ